MDIFQAIDRKPKRHILKVVVFLLKKPRSNKQLNKVATNV